MNEDRPPIASDRIVTHWMYFSTLYFLRWFVDFFAGVLHTRTAVVRLPTLALARLPCTVYYGIALVVSVEFFAVVFFVVVCSCLSLCLDGDSG